MDRTLIFLLDRSGSMETCRADTIGGFNAFVADQKTLGGKLTLVQFDHEIKNVFENVPLGEVNPLTSDTFQPRGSTALMDAIGRTIKTHWSKKGVVFIIQTDGEENSSHAYTKAHIKDLIEQKTKDGWTFMYLGANQDAFAEAGSMGIAPCATLHYDVARTPEAFRQLSATVSQQASNN
jgi:hypothetical protein